MSKLNLNIVLYEPEIAGNVGSIMRTCAATNSKLHLIEPLGFFLDDRFLQRASVKHINNIQYVVYDSIENFWELNKNINPFFATRYGQKPHSDINFTKESNHNIFIFFGKESTGIPKKILKKHFKKCFRIPMQKKVRSLNLANTASIVIYEILRQFNYPELSFVETQKGKNWINE